MARRRKKQKPGVPEWVVTYGDMMSLLLTFFILLAAFSELKRDHEYQRVITAVKEAFGYSGGVGVMPTDDPPLRSMIEQLETLSKESLKESKVSQSSAEGVKGKQTEVSRIPEGMRFTIGGGMSFERDSATLKEGAESELERIASTLKGRKNRILVRGHASGTEGGELSSFDDVFDLSYARAKKVREVLVETGGLRPEQVVIEAMGALSPLERRAYTEEEQADNRRVEIVMTEQIAEDASSVEYSREPGSGESIKGP